MKEIIQSLEELLNLHRELLNVSKEKTEVIKDGEVDKLQSVLVKERKLVRKIEKAEGFRMELVGEWFDKEGMPSEDQTITRMLNEVKDEEDKGRLEEVTIELTKVMTDLKAQEKLNLALLNQSMQFVQLSLDLISPTLKNMNYSNKHDQHLESPNRSIFDSKA